MIVWNNKHKQRIYPQLSKQTNKIKMMVKYKTLDFNKMIY